MSLSTSSSQWELPRPNPLSYSFGFGADTSTSSEYVSNTTTSNGSSDVAAASSSSTPGGMMSSMSMPMSMSPSHGRKRGRQVQMARQSDTDSSDDSDQDNDRMSVNSQYSRASPYTRRVVSTRPVGFAKRQRVVEETVMSGTRATNSSINPAAFGVPSTMNLDKQLATLDKDHVVSMLRTLLSVYPQLQSHASALIPRPTLSTATTHLTRLEKKMWESFPYSKAGVASDRSEYAYTRVRNSLGDLREALEHYLCIFTDPSQYPEALSHDYPGQSFAYLHWITTLVHRLPRWDNSRLNAETVETMYTMVGGAWRAAISEVGRRFREEGKMFGEEVVGEWYRNLMLHASNVSGLYGLGTAVGLFQNEFGMLFGRSQGIGTVHMASGLGMGYGFPVAGAPAGTGTAM
ncbi:hypothetical protein BJ742DRAFT_272469 [Cladochytrium replicatum]|nr:hypothetical protein BJ742DRAFT_272469 [Cladochytrium replicatum]